MSTNRQPEDVAVIGAHAKTYKRTHTIYVIGDVAFVANPTSRSSWWKTHVSVAIGACPTCGAAIGQVCVPSFGFCHGNTHAARRRLARGRDQVAMKVDVQSVAPSNKRLQRARAKLRVVQHDLAEAQVDLVAYERVVIDMTRRSKDGLISPYSGGATISLVKIFRDAVCRQCADLAKAVKALEKDGAALENASTPKETKRS